MFSKKPLPTYAAPAPRAATSLAGAKSFARTVAANPYMSAGGAAALFLGVVCGLIGITGDAQAGSPMITLSLAKTAKDGAAVPGWREALTAETSGEAPMSTGDLQLSDQPVELAMGGVATITLPGGGELTGSGGAPAAVMALTSGPAAGLTAPGPGGALLPVVGPDGRTAAQTYARPFTANGKPRIALVIGGLGLNPAYTRRAIEALPPEVTLSFAPYAEGLQGWIDMARAAGHEVLLEAPMEPTDYPQNDPGPYTLLTSASPAETVGRMEWLLSRATGYFGVTNYLGSKFVTSTPAMATFAGVLRQRGVAFIDDGSAAGRGAGPARASADRIVDEDLASDSIAKQLAALEAGAVARGQALGSGFAYPVTIETAANWARALESRGFQLAPASALMNRRNA